MESIYFFVLHWPCSATCRLTCKFTDEKIQQNEISFEKIQVGEKFPYACIQSILGTPGSLLISLVTSHSTTTLNFLDASFEQ